MPTKLELQFVMESDLEFGYPDDRGSEHDAIGSPIRKSSKPKKPTEPTYTQSEVLDIIGKVLERAYREGHTNCHCVEGYCNGIDKQSILSINREQFLTK